MTTLGRTELDEIIEGARSPEMPLPSARPLSLTRNFFWIVAMCGVILALVPVLAGWVAGVLLS